MNSSQYTIIVSEISGIADVFSDVGGGRWCLAIFCELLQELIISGEWKAARMGIEKLYEATESKCEINYESEDAVRAFVFALSESITDDE